MRVRFWGTRGSIATPGEDTVRYGGNTSCIELRSASGTLILIDCGTGIRGFGDQLMASGPRRLSGHILISHTHWDHIQGLPFFTPLFVPGNEWDIYAPQGFEQSLQETLAGQMQYAYFPITLRDLGATLRYHEIVEGTFRVGDVRVTAQYLNHPALTLGYRLEADGAAVVYACDHEPHSRSLAAGDGNIDIDGHDRQHVEFLASADLVIHDAQYTAAEYEGKKGWGHSTGEYAAEAARCAGVHRLALTHHDPRRDDAAVDDIVAAIRRRVAASGSAMEVFGAAEGLEFVLHGEPDRHLALLTGEVSAAAPLPSAFFERTVLLGVADPVLAATLREAVAADGIRAIVEADGDRALARALDERPSLVILEHRLPGMDGPTVGGALRSRGGEIEGDLPIIVVAESERNAAAGAGEDVSDWLVKPLSVAYLRTRVRSWLLRTPCRWQKAPIPPDEETRLAALHRLGLLDTPPEERFDRLTRVAAAIFDVPTALVSLVDRDRQWFKSGYGDGPRETPREMSFCAHAVAGHAPLVVPDAMQDARFADNPMVTGEERVRFYAGQPLILPDGSCVGTVCLVDTRPRELDERQKGLLADIGELVRRELLLADRQAGAAAASARSPTGG